MLQFIDKETCKQHRFTNNNNKFNRIYKHKINIFKSIALHNDLYTLNFKMYRRIDGYIHLLYGITADENYYTLLSFSRHLISVKTEFHIILSMTQNHRR